MKKKKNYDELSKQIVEAIGGKENVSFITHCLTRLRFNVKEKGRINVEQINDLNGVIGSQWVGNQFQIIIGQHVKEVYAVLAGSAEFENIIQQSKEKEKITLKTLINKLMDTLASCMTPLIPMLIAASFVKTIGTILSPNILNVISESSDLYTLFTFVGDAGLYFFPVAVGYTAAKKFGANPMMGIFIGAILIHPSFLQMAVEGGNFTVYGIPCNLQTYSYTILPSILSVYVYSVIERQLNDRLPVVLRTVLVPVLSTLLILPLSLCLFGPLGATIGTVLKNAMIIIGESGTIGLMIGAGFIGMTWNIIIMFGMHWVFIPTVLELLATRGFDDLIIPASGCSVLALLGAAIAVLIKTNRKETKAEISSYIFTHLVGGITEPEWYGVGIRYRKTLFGILVGGFIGGAYMGLFRVAIYNLVPVSNVMMVTMFLGGDNSMNFVHAMIAYGISAVLAFVITYKSKISDEK